MTYLKSCSPEAEVLEQDVGLLISFLINELTS